MFRGGQVIGLVGMTGCATGPHLPLGDELVSGQTFDPSRSTAHAGVPGRSWSFSRARRVGFVAVRFWPKRAGESTTIATGVDLGWRLPSSRHSPSSSAARTSRSRIVRMVRFRSSPFGWSCERCGAGPCARWSPAARLRRAWEREGGRSRRRHGVAADERHGQTFIRLLVDQQEDRFAAAQEREDASRAPVIP